MHQFYLTSGLICVKLKEIGPSKIITHTNCKSFMEFFVNHFKLMLPFAFVFL